MPHYAEGVKTRNRRVRRGYNKSSEAAKILGIAFHSFAAARVKGVQMQVCALICQTFTFDLGKIFLEQDLQPPKVAHSSILKKLRGTPRQLPYSAVNKNNMD
jgi:hypothetical protein